MRQGYAYTRRQFLASALATSMVLVGAAFAQSYQFSISRITIHAPVRQPLNIVFLTDLHFGIYIGKKSLRSWVDAALKLRPDLIVLGGDYLDIDYHSDASDFLSELSRLWAPLGVYGVWGNHDYGSFGRYDSRWRGPALPTWQQRQQQFIQDFAAAGIQILHNSGRVVRDDLFVAGLGDWYWGEPNLSKTMLEADGSRASLLLSHSPDVLPQIDQLAPQHKPDFTLCGHTHGGQVRLPWLGALKVPSRYGQRYAMGWVTSPQGSPAYVSRGLGVSGLPLRNACVPEIVSVSLRPFGY